MESGSNTFRLFAIGTLVTLVALAFFMILPHDRYVRWQAVRLEAFARAGWVYERIHFDRTPIDVAFIGTSHTMNGVDGQAVASRMAARGARTADGRCVTVTNLAIPSYGRNLHWLLARELMQNRKPGLIVLEAFENETRKAHPLFAQLGDSRDVIAAPKLVNINYLVDVARLPYRNLSVAVQSLAPEVFGLKSRFSAARYDGSTVDNTYAVNVNGQALTPPLTKAIDPVALEAAAAQRRADKDLNMLPKMMEGYEYAIPRTYVAAILDYAAHRKVPVAILYLPSYGQPPLPYDMHYYARHRMITANDVLAHREYWHDPDHLNAQGAAVLSQRLGDDLAKLYPVAAGRGEGGSCDFGYPAKPPSRPFRTRPHVG